MSEPRLGFIDVAGLRLHVAQAGPETGPPVVLLHGFPEFWWGWRRQIGPLAAAGHRVIAPDQRGYHLSAKPRGLAAYSLDRLAGDVVDLLDALGLERAAVVGHDWGAAVAWWTAIRFPQRIERLAILNTPHPAAFRKLLASDADQRRRVRYMLYFQLPWLPERKLAAGGFRPFRKIFRVSSRPGTFSEEELDRYAAAAATPGALSGMLAWYRAGLRRPPRRPPTLAVAPPTLILWGLADVALSPKLAGLSAAYCREVTLVELPEAGHWVQHEAADEVNARLLAFLSAARSPA